MLEMRNKIVAVFGLKTPGNLKALKKHLQDFNCEPGERIGLFQVFEKTENELILGENDKYLDFRISLLLEDNPNRSTQKSLTLTTTVAFHNWFGRLYFLPVKPFHKLVVPAMLKALIKELERQNMKADKNAAPAESL